MEVQIDGETFLDVREAAEVTGYSREYVRRLARQERVESTKQGHWVFIKRSSILAYKAEMDELGTSKYGHGSRS